MAEDDAACSEVCARATANIPRECLETSLACIAENLYGPDPRQMLSGMLKLMRTRYIRAHGNDSQFEADLQHFLPASRQDTTSLAALPQEIIEHIIYFLRDDPTTLGVMAQVCRSWRLIISQPRIWRDVCAALWSCPPSPQAYTTKLQELIGQNDFRPSLREIAPLVFAGAKLDEAVTRCGGTPLLSAAFNGHLNVVEFLLRNGAPRDSTVKGGKNALMVSSFRNHQHIVAYLAHNGFSLRDRDAYNNTPFMLACLGGAIKVMTWLKAQGIMLSDTNCYGYTAMHCAALGGNRDAIARVHQYGFDLHQRALSGQTPLLVAAAYGRAPAVAFLAQLGADLAARDRHGATAVMLASLGCLHSAVNSANGRDGHASLVYNLLVQQGHIFNVNDRDSLGRTALHYALPNRNFPVVQKLYALAVDQQARDNFGATAHDYAALVRALSNNQFERTCDLLGQFTGLALTFACTGRAVFSDSEFRDLLRALRGNTTVRTIVLINACVNIREHMEDLLALFAENRNITHFDLGREQNSALPLVIQEYLAANRKLAESGGECDALERSALAASMAGSAAHASVTSSTPAASTPPSLHGHAAPSGQPPMPEVRHQQTSQWRAHGDVASTLMNEEAD